MSGRTASATRSRGPRALTGSAAVTVAVAAAAPPIAAGDTVTLLQNTSVLIDVLGNDTGLGLTLTSVTPPQFGAATIVNGQVRYTATLGYAGPDSFSYTATDVNGQTVTAAVTVTVTVAVVAPAPVADTASAVEGAAVLIDVLANDTGTGLVLTGVGAVPHGMAVIQNGKILYTAANGYVGSDTFTYTVTGSTGLTGTGSVTVTATAANPPVAAADSAAVLQGVAVLINVLANDAGSGLVLTNVGAPQHGTASIQNGQVLYTAPASYAGPDSFTYTETDVNGLTATAAVAITVTAPVIPPAAAADTASVLEGNTVVVDVLANDAGTGLTLTALGAPQHGTATVQNGKVLYAAANGYVGADSFSYTVTGSTGLTATASVGITVTAAAPPAATADTATVLQGGFVLINVLGNDAGTGLALTSLMPPQHGTAAIQSGQVLYTPAVNYAGPDAFTYTATDINDQTETGAVAVTVTSAAALPMPAPDTATVVEGASVLVNVLANDTGAGLTLTDVGQAAHGVAAIENGAIRYTAGASFVGTDTVTYGGDRQQRPNGVLHPHRHHHAARRRHQRRAHRVLALLHGAGERVRRRDRHPPRRPTPAVAATALTVTLTALPSNGAVTLSNGVLVSAGQTITTAQLTGLMFTPHARRIRHILRADLRPWPTPAGNIADGVAMLAIGRALAGPAVSQPSDSFAASAGTTPLGIVAPSDPNYPPRRADHHRASAAGQWRRHPGGRDARCGWRRAHGRATRRAAVHPSAGRDQQRIELQLPGHRSGGQRQPRRSRNRSRPADRNGPAHARLRATCRWRPRGERDHQREPANLRRRRRWQRHDPAAGRRGQRRRQCGRRIRDHAARHGGAAHGTARDGHGGRQRQWARSLRGQQRRAAPGAAGRQRHGHGADGHRFARRGDPAARRLQPAVHAGNGGRDTDRRRALRRPPTPTRHSSSGSTRACWDAPTMSAA